MKERSLPRADIVARHSCQKGTLQLTPNRWSVLYVS